MHTVESLTHWMHTVHEKGVQAAHATEHLLHQKAFWMLMAFVMFFILILSLVLLPEGSVTIPNQPQHYPYSMW